jgi:hypothetical protein
MIAQLPQADPPLCELILYPQTRWIGSLAEIECLLTYQEVFEGMRKLPKYKNLVIIPKNFWLVLEDLFCCLSVFQTPILQFQQVNFSIFSLTISHFLYLGQTKNPMVSFQIIVLEKIYSCLDGLDKDMTTAIGLTFLKVLQESFSARFGRIFQRDLSDDNFLSFAVAEFLDPTASRLRSVGEFSAMKDEVFGFLAAFIKIFDFKSKTFESSGKEDFNTQKTPKRTPFLGNFCFLLWRLFIMHRLRV